MTHDPPARVAVVLRTLRDVAGEILVAVDSRVEPSALHALRGVADRIIRFEARAPVDRPRPWLASQCRGDWVFWIDGDEVPSLALVNALPDLVAARDVVQYHIPRRWLFPDADHWLDESPWWPDHQIRLLRNDPATMRYGATHEPIVPWLPWRCIEPPLYHLSCLVTSIAARRAKARDYDVERPNMTSPGGGPFNDVLQVPEQYATRRPSPVPIADRAWIDAALAITAAPAASDVDPLFTSIVPTEEIDALAPATRLGPDDYQAQIEIVDRDTRFAPGIARYLLVRVENRGGATWSWGWQRFGINLSYHWRSLDGNVLTFGGRRTTLPSTVRPGESILLAVDVVPPNDSGRYVLDVDLVHEEVRWFGCAARIEVSVADRWE